MPCIISYGNLKKIKKVLKFQGVRQLGSYDINDKFKENIKNFQAVHKSK